MIASKRFLILLLVMSLLGIASPPARAADPPVECNAENDGAIWTNPEHGISWICKHVPGMGWRWIIHIKGTWATWTNQVKAFDRIGIGPGDGGGYALSRVQRNTTAYPANPIGGSVGSFLARIKLFVHSDGNWVQCRDSDWWTNSAAGYGFRLGWTFGAEPPCGPGHYGNLGAGFTWNGDEWVGGWVWSGYRWIGGGPLDILADSGDPGSTRPSAALELPPPPAQLPVALNPPPLIGLETLSDWNATR